VSDERGRQYRFVVESKSPLPTLRREVSLLRGSQRAQTTEPDDPWAPLSRRRHTRTYARLPTIGI
jgi:hypothetical protein